MARRDRREGEGSQSVRHGAQAPSADAQSSTRPVLQALHHLVGNHGVEGLEQAGTTDSMQLYLRHLTQISEGHQLDTSAYMPDVAPQSWLREITPLYDVLAQDRAIALESAATSEHADSSTSTASSEASVAAPISRLASGMQVVDEDEDAVENFDRMMGQTGMGRALTDQEQQFLTRVHGRSFPEIRVHEGGTAEKAARQIHAKAFAEGTDIYVAGRIDIGTAQGAELLAHEATHVVQAEEGRLPTARGGGLQVSDPSQSHEREADRIGKAAASEVSGGGGEDPWGLARVPIFDSTGQAIVDHLGRVLPDPATLDSDHRTALENTLSAGREHAEPAGLLESVAGDLIGGAASTAAASGAGLALHREAEGGGQSTESSESSGGAQEQDGAEEETQSGEYETTTAGVWLVSDPSHYGETVQDRLPEGTRLRVLDRGVDQPFNQTDVRYQWWSVEVVDGGGAGWVMQTLLAPAPDSDTSGGESQSDGELDEGGVCQEEVFESYEQEFCEQDGPVLTSFDASGLASEIEVPANISISDPKGSGPGLVISLFAQFLAKWAGGVGASPADYDRRWVQAKATVALQQEIAALNTQEVAVDLLNMYMGNADQEPQQYVTFGFGIGCIVLQQVGYMEIIEDFQGAVAAAMIAPGIGNLDRALLREKTMAVAEPLRAEAESGWGSKSAHVQYHHQVEEVNLADIFGDRSQYQHLEEYSEPYLSCESESEQSEWEWP